LFPLLTVCAIVLLVTMAAGESGDFGPGGRDDVDPDEQLRRLRYDQVVEEAAKARAERERRVKLLQQQVDTHTAEDTSAKRQLALAAATSIDPVQIGLLMVIVGIPAAAAARALRPRGS
jgi:hypothetical protein